MRGRSFISGGVKASGAGFTRVQVVENAANHYVQEANIIQDINN